MSDQGGFDRIGHGVGDASDQVVGSLAFNAAGRTGRPDTLELPVVGVDGTGNELVTVALEVDDRAIRVG